MRDYCQNYFIVILAMNYEAQQESESIHIISVVHPVVCTMEVIIRAVGWSLPSTRFGTSIVATIYLQLIQNRYMFRSFTVLQCSHQYCVQPVASDVEVVGYL